MHHAQTFQTHCAVSTAAQITYMLPATVTSRTWKINTIRVAATLGRRSESESGRSLIASPPGVMLTGCRSVPEHPRGVRWSSLSAGLRALGRSTACGTLTARPAAPRARPPAGKLFAQTRRLLLNPGQDSVCLIAQPGRSFSAHLADQLLRLGLELLHGTTNLTKRLSSG